MLTLRRCVPALAGVVLGASALASSASAGVILIDDFTSVGAPNPWPVMLFAPGSELVMESGLSALGGTRDTFIAAMSMNIPGLDFLSAAIAPGPGLFDYNSTAGTDGYLSLGYSGGGALNVDFSQMTGIQLDFALFDHAGGAPMPVTIHITDGTEMAMHTLALNAPGAQSVLFSFADFMNIGMVNLASIRNIHIEFDPAIGVDFRLGQITAVPGPGALALLGLGAMIARRRRR